MPVFSIIIGIFLILVLILFYFRYFQGFRFHKATVNEDRIITISEKLQNQINSQKGEEEIKITVTEEDMNDTLTSNKETLGLKDTKAEIIPDKIIITGKTDNLLNLAVEISIIPRIENGNIIFEVKEMKAGGLPAPNKLVESITPGLNDVLSSLKPDPYQVKIEKIQLLDKYLEISGKKA